MLVYGTESLQTAGVCDSLERAALSRRSLTLFHIQPFLCPGVLQHLGQFLSGTVTCETFRSKYGGGF